MSTRLQLRISESRYRRLFETAQDGILILDANSGEVADVNPFLQQKLGYPHEYFLGKKLWELGAFKDIPESKAAFLELQEREYVRYEDLPLKAADGRPFQVEFISNVYLVDGAKVIQCNIRDISARKRAEQKKSLRASQLEVSNHELELFTSSAAHDMREALLNVINLGGLLQSECRGMLDKSGNEYVGLILKSANHMQALLNNLLGYSHVGQNDPIPESIDCEAELAQVIALLHSTIVQRNAVITHGRLPVLMGVRTEIDQLLQNLIANAIKFQPGDRPSVHISALRDGAFWKFSVHDEGIGIPPEHQQRIFNIFQRLHSTDEYEGSGIGLALCEKIVRRHGGRIWVESAHSKGTTFYFTLAATPSLVSLSSPE